MREHFYAVIMAGGGGTRLWPASRPERPKQLMSFGSSNDSLLWETVERAAGVVGQEHVLVVVAANGKKAVLEDLKGFHAKQVPAESVEGKTDASEAKDSYVPHEGNRKGVGIHPMGVPGVLVEPVGRNTAPCIGLAAVLLAQKDPEAVMAVLPADHHIQDVIAFRKTVTQALEQAEKGFIVTLGIRPDRPETGYGYIETGSLIDGAEDVYWSKGFVEKPDLKTAQKYLNAGNFLWNSGMFFMSAKKIIEEIHNSIPDLSKALTGLKDALGRGEGAFKEELQRVYPELESVSVDYGVMEKVNDLQVIPADIGWNDVGSWSALEDILVQDEDDNTKQGEALFVESKGCVTYSDDGKLIALLGMKDIVVVSSGEGVLVCPKDKAQNVREITDLLKNQ
jgi:mannose-1-phosphate guanylyltransferase